MICVSSDLGGSTLTTYVHGAVLKLTRAEATELAYYLEVTLKNLKADDATNALVARLTRTYEANE